jgi:hypothetical protein
LTDRAERKDLLNFAIPVQEKYPRRKMMVPEISPGCEVNCFSATSRSMVNMPCKA